MTALGVIEGEALLELVWAAPAAGLALTVAFSLAILGATRTADMRAAGRPLEATVYAVMGTVAFAVVLAALAFGIVVMTSK